MKNKHKEILVIVQYPEKVSPGQRFRIELYKETLAKNGFVITTRPFFDQKGYEIIHRHGFFLKKMAATLKGYLARFISLLRIRKYEFVFL